MPEKNISDRSRSPREIGVALLFASGVLACFLFISFLFQQPPTAPTIVIAPVGPDAFARVPLEARAAIVYDVTTGETLYEKNADAQLPLASLTKLLTVHAAFAQLSPNTPITISAPAVNTSAPHIFSVGQTFSLADLARLTLTASLNDGAAAIAEAVATHTNQTQSEMLASAAAGLNLTQTYALNGSGLDVNTAISGGYGSARDLAHLAGALVAEAPEITSATTQSVTEGISREGKTIKVKNTDPMIGSLPRLLLSKTGYTDLAGGNLALVFDAGINHPIAVIVLGSSGKERFTDGIALVAATLAHFSGVASL